MTVPREVIWTLRWCARLLLLLAWAAMLSWMIGRLFSDRSFWTQFLFWMPSWILLSGAGLCFSLCAAIDLVAFPRPRAGAPAAGPRAPDGVMSRRWRRFAWVVWGIMVLAMLFGEFRVHRAVLPRERDPSALRILAWNPSEWPPSVEEAIAAHEPEVVLISNPPWRSPLSTLASRVGTTSSAVMERFACLSKHRVLGWAWLELDVSGAKLRTFTWKGGGYTTHDVGQAMLLRLDTTEKLGRPITVWIIDLPSDWDIPRQRMMTEAAAAIKRFRGPAYRRTEDGLDAIDSTFGPSHPLMQPDIAAGDFNTPRGSRSIATLLPNMHHAHTDAGWGPDMTYPRRPALLAIDHVFLAPSLRATRYSVRDPGVGKHRLQVAEVVPRK